MRPLAYGAKLGGRWGSDVMGCGGVGVKRGSRSGEIG
jgi:hypothetical protein